MPIIICPKEQETTKSYNPNIHHRKLIRVKGYDYSQLGLYFITICCQDRACLIGEMIDCKMILNVAGHIVDCEWLNTDKIRENCRLHEFILMPNHIHGIIEITFNKLNKDATGKFQSPSHSTGSFIIGFKITTIKKIKDIINNSSSTGELAFAPTGIFTSIDKIKNLNFKI